MKQIKLLSLSLKNFKGIKEFVFRPDGQSCTVYAQNGKGKTTLADGLNWLLFDKSSAGQKDFGLKPTDAQGREINNLEHSVAATLSVDGLAIELNKVMTEKWTKKRGSSAPEFSGHETAYFVNDVPTAKSEYDQSISDICGSDQIFRLLTSTKFFNSMKWQDRRIILLDVSGDVTDADVFAANKKLAELAELAKVLNGRSLSDHLKIIKVQRPKINTEIEKLPARMDEAGRDKPGEASTIPPSGNYADLKAGLESLIRQRAAVLAGDTSEIKSQIMAIQEDIQRIGTVYRDTVRKSDDERRVFEVAIEKAELEKEDHSRNIARLKNDVAACDNKRENLITEWKEIYAKTMPTEVCNMGMAAADHPGYDADAALKRFNDAKAEKVKRNTEAGKANNANKNFFEGQIEEAEAKISTLDTEIQLAREAFGAIPNPAEPDYILKQAAIKSLEDQIATVSTPDTSRIDQQIDESKMLIEKHDAASMNLKRAGDIDARIAELKKEQKALAVELEKIDKEIMLCEDFTRAKVSMLTGAVNAKFAPLSFKLFDQQINGGIAECCEVMRDGVPYGDLSKGQKAVAGLTIIKALSDHYGTTCPVFVDDAEGITLELPLVEGGQYIKLVADAAYSELTVKN